MDDCDKWRLTQNRCALLEDIPTHEICQKLRSGPHCIFSKHDTERIDYKQSTSEKNSLLLDILETKGPRAYQALQSSLKDTKIDHLVDVLDNTDFTDYRSPENKITEDKQSSCASMTVIEVKSWLTSVCGLPAELVESFEKNVIDGEALDDIFSDEDPFKIIKDHVCPEIPLKYLFNIKKAYRKKLDTFSSQPVDVSVSGPPEKEIVNAPVSSVNEKEASSLRRFGASGTAVKYTVDTEVPESDDLNLLAPVHKYVSCKDSTVLKNRSVMEGVAATVAACINCYQNLTIHFGINGHKTGGDIKGFLVGEKFESDFRENLLQQFVEDQRCLVASLLSKCIPIPVESSEKGQLKVVEIDVTPSFKNADDMFIASETNEKLCFYIWRNGQAELLDATQTEQFLKERPKWQKARRFAENGEVAKPPTCYDEKLNGMTTSFTLGNKVISDGIYPVLILNSLPHNTSVSEIVDRYSLFNNVQWKVVLDFTGNRTLLDCLLNAQKAISIREIKSIAECDDGKLLVPNATTWVLMNNDRDSAILDGPKWRRANTDNTRKLVAMMNNEMPNNRVSVLFALLSENDKIMMEIFPEIDKVFPNQWSVVCESQELLNNWNSEIIRRTGEGDDYEEQLNDRSTAGVPWHLISETLKSVTRPQINAVCKIPSSRGETIINDKSDWSCLELIGMNECEDVLKGLVKVRNIADLQKEEEERFYRGADVSWLNFAFKGQVCRRDIHQKLLGAVEDTLKGKRSGYLDGDSGAVGVINFYHQPGAGATTSSRQVLWDLRKKFKCAVVKEVVPNMTCRQILDFRGLHESEESRTDPVLLLVDSEESENVRLLRAELETEARRIARETVDLDEESKEPRDADKSHPFIVVMLVCCRQTILPSKEIGLGHNLKEREKQWFKEKSLELEQNFNNHQGTDPKFLFSFNIMKTSFSQDAITSVVTELVKDMTSEKEKKVLRYVALLNHYDQEQFRAIPTSAFDSIMGQHETGYNRGNVMLPWRQRKRHRLQVNWETQTSDSWKLLITEATGGHNSYHCALRICNRLVAQQILRIFTQDELVENIINGLLDEEIFSSEANYYYHKGLYYILRDILKKRVRQKETEQVSAFAPLILDIAKASPETAVQVLIKGNRIFNDPFISQHIARFYIFRFNDDDHDSRALGYIQEAVRQKPENSYLLDTCGRVHKQRLVRAQSYVNDGHVLTIEEAKLVIKSSFDAISAFREAQRFSISQANHGMINTSGYYGELDIMKRLLEILPRVPGLQDHNTMKRFLTERGFTPEPLSYLRNVNEHDMIRALKSLDSSVEQTLGKVADIETQLREEFLDKKQRASNKTTQRDMASVIEFLQHYFGRDIGAHPEKLNEQGKCEFRRRQVFRLGCSTFSRMIIKAKFKGEKATNEDEGEERTGGDNSNFEYGLNEVLKLMLENVKQEHNSKDLCVLLGAHITRSCILKKPTIPNNVNFRQLVEWSQQLYERRELLAEVRIFLEPYLFYVMLNWPPLPRTTDAATNYLHSPSHLNAAIENWKADYRKKYSALDKGARSSYSIKERVIFFLGRNRETDRYIHSTEFGYMGVNFWKSEAVKKRLFEFEGKVTENLDSVEVSYGMQSEPLRIASAVPAYQFWRHKKVTFYIGFTWSGPMAYGVSKPQNVTERSLVKTAGARPVKNDESKVKTAESRVSKTQNVDEPNQVRPGARLVTSDGEGKTAAWGVSIPQSVTGREQVKSPAVPLVADNEGEFKTVKSRRKGNKGARK